MIEKLRRADKHLIALFHEISEYVDSTPYELVAKRDPDNRAVMIFRVTRQPPLAFATAVGDVIANMRSALDYIAHELIKRNGCTPHPTRVQFPICTTVRDFDNEAIANRRLCAISLFGYRLIDAMQPHQVRKGKPEAHPLWHLAKLSNLDKHRSLALSAFSLHYQWIYVGSNGRVQTVKSDKMLHHGDVAARLPPGFNPKETAVHGKLTCQVAFQDPPAVDHEVIATLQHIREFIGEIVLPAVKTRFDPLPDHLRIETHGIPTEMVKEREFKGPDAPLAIVVYGKDGTVAIHSAIPQRSKRRST